MRNPLHNTLLVILEGAGAAAPPLLDWASQFRHVWRRQHPFSSGVPDLLAVWRNRLIRDFLTSTRLPAIIMADADTIPLPETAELVVCDAPVAACRAIGKGGREVHGRDGEMSLQMFRATRAALRAMGPPWFGFEVSNDGSEIVACDCQWFARRARQAGIIPRRVGAVGHLVTMIAAPSPAGGVRATFPASWGRRERDHNPAPPGDAPCGQRCGPSSTRRSRSRRSRPR